MIAMVKTWKAKEGGREKGGGRGGEEREREREIFLKKNFEKKFLKKNFEKKFWKIFFWKKLKSEWAIKSQIQEKYYYENSEIG